MERYIEKAATLIEALPYIQSYRDKYVVIKYGGSAMVDNEHADSLLRDIVLLECVGIRPVLIHGGGKAISDRMKEAGIAPNFVHGLRVTDKKTVSIVDKVLAEINGRIVKKIASYGGDAKGLTSRDRVIIAKKHFVEEANRETGKIERIDIGFVGDVTRINAGPIRKIAEKNSFPVIAPVGVGNDGSRYNINADTVACAIAAALKAEKLVLMTDVKGILKDENDESTVISTLRTKEVDALIAKKVIGGGMIPKVKACVGAIRAGVRKIHIIDARIRHSLLLEIFTAAGVGTEIIK
jgi:acetylglutamate kinase